MAVTIEDVARLASVSRQTVSRVINNLQGVKPETRMRVLQAVEKINYYPNIAARRLASQSVENIGLVIPFSHEQMATNPFFPQIISAICNACSERNYGLQIYSHPRTEEFVPWFSRLYREKHIGGLIIACPDVNERQIVLLQALDIPVIFVGRPALTVGMSYIDHNIEKIGYQAADYLAAQGYTGIAMINGPSFMTFSQDQLAGFKASLTDRRLEYRQEWMLYSDFTEENGFELTRRLIKSNSRPTAIYLVNDTLTLGALEALHDEGLQVLKDIELVAGVDRRWGVSIRDSISAFQLDIPRLGVTAVKMLMAKMDGNQECMVRIIEAPLIVRNASTKAS